MNGSIISLGNDQKLIIRIHFQYQQRLKIRLVIE